MAEDKFISVSNRPEWADIQPIPQDDGPTPICVIAYTPQFTETMNYFRAILQKNEISERALALTEELIELNPANYTVWHYRRILLNSLQLDLKSELEWTTAIGKETPKNYQIWWHRRCIVELLKDGSEELAYTTLMIEEDSKNYHAWAHRQWATTTFSLWDSELAAIEEFINGDCRNNSAWNQRFFLVSHFGWTPETRDKEIDFAIHYIKKAPNNQSPWAYLRGVVNTGHIGDHAQVKEFCLMCKEKYPTCGHALSMLIDICIADSNTHLAKELCRDLAVKVDPIHNKYWIYRELSIAQ